MGVNIKQNEILVFGTGRYYQEHKYIFEHAEILAFIDNDKNKQGKIFDGREIISPDDLAKYNNPIVCVMVGEQFQKEIAKQLADNNIPKENILLGCEGYAEYSPIASICVSYNKQIYSKKDNGKTVYVCSWYLDVNGADIVLLYAVKLLIKSGYRVYVYSALDGQMKSDYIEAGAIVIISPEFNKNTILFNAAMKADIFLVNTYWHTNLIKEIINFNKPIIWWIHEADYMLYYDSEIESICKGSNNLFIYGVSKISQNAFKKILNTDITGILPFGIPDEKGIKDNKINDKIIFSIIGAVCIIKAQDIFIKAANMLPEKECQNAEFWIIGNDKSEWAESLKRKSANNEKIKWLGELSHSEVLNIYPQISVNVCPSREETMSAVSIEAMMNLKPVIVSDNTGIADYVKDYETGFIVKAGDAEDLAEKMKWMINNKDKLQDMGANARQVYEENFSMDKFKSKINEVFNQFN